MLAEEAEIKIDLQRIGTNGEGYKEKVQRTKELTVEIADLKKKLNKTILSPTMRNKSKSNVSMLTKGIKATKTKDLSDEGASDMVSPKSPKKKKQFEY